MARRLRLVFMAVFTTAFLVSLAQGYVRSGINWATERIWPTDRIAACVDDTLRDLRPGHEHPFTVAFTQLANDSQGRQTRTIDDTLRVLFDSGPGGGTLRLVSIPCTLIAQGGDVARNQEAAADRAEAIARRLGADVVIWGEVRARADTLDLHFTHAEGLDADRFTVEDYSLGLAFDEALGALVAAKAVSLADSVADDAGRHVVPLLEQVLRVTAPLAADPPRTLPALQRGHLFEAHARALHGIGEQGGRHDDLRGAIAAHRTALSAYAEANDAWEVARTQNNLGNALQTLGAREGDAATLQAAVDAYRAALEERSRDRVPLDWAMTQNNLANAQAMLGRQEADATALRAAVDAYRAALEEWTRHRVPLDWAATQNNLGNALQILGRQEGDAAALRAAVDAYSAALQERSRDRVPLDWAATQNNLGVALRTLGEREDDAAALRAAITAFRTALEERTRDRVPLDWAATQSNLGAALLALGDREGDAAALREAMAALRAALEERSRERVPVGWGLTQHNMAGAALALFRLTGEAAQLQAAWDHAQAAVAVFREVGAAGYLPDAEARLAEIAAARDA